MVIFLGIPFSIKAENSNEKKSVISVNGGSVEIDRNKNLVTITKDVCVKNDEFTLTCDKLFFYYLDPKDETDDSSMEDRISRLIADGNVIIEHVNGDKSNAGHAEYDKNLHEFILTENPNVHIGKDVFAGCKIIYYLKDGNISVDSCGEEKVTMTIHEK